MTPIETLEKIVAEFPKTAVLVVGDVMLDRFVYGHVDRISPESPVPVLSVDRETQMLGGAGNALANLAGLGVQATLLSVVGDDAAGQEIESELEKLGAPKNTMIVDSSRPTIIKTRFLSGHQQLLRSDYETKAAPSDAAVKALLKQAEELIAKAGAVILSDYGKGTLTQEVISGVIDMAAKKNVPVIVDPKGQDFSIYRGAFAVTPNKKELSEAMRGAPVAEENEIIEAAQKLIAECGIETVFATRSKDGISVVQAGSALCHVKSHKQVEVYDVSGAGDTVIAVIAASIAAGAELPAAAELANMAGSLVVTKVGTAPIRLVELEDVIHDRGVDVSQGLYSAPIMDEDSLAEQVRRWKARGLKVGFTNGCFDILHSGHVAYLAQARMQCDRLIVGLNHDHSVKILKGPERPIHPEGARADVLGALASVDSIILFGAMNEGEDNTASKLLEYIQPDLYFKGGDYRVEDVPEAPTVRSYGGEVRILDIVEGQSTSSSIKKIKTQAA